MCSGLYRVDVSSADNKMTFYSINVLNPPGDYLAFLLSGVLQESRGRRSKWSEKASNWNERNVIWGFNGMRKQESTIRRERGMRK